MNRKEIFDAYAAKHTVPDFIEKKININSFLTDNFAFGALRIGNSIGDLLDISIEIVLLEEVAKKFDLIVDTTEHAELHSNGTTEKDLDQLIKGAIIFENIRNNKKRYKKTLKDISDYIRKDIVEIIEHARNE